MNEKNREDIKKIKFHAKLVANHWMRNSFPRVYKQTNNRQYNDNCISDLQEFWHNFVLNIRDQDLFQFYTLKYIILMIINVIDANSDKQPYCSYHEKPKFFGI